MSDSGTDPRNAAPGPHAPQPPNGCLTALMVIAGLILLLPAFCTLLVTGGQLEAQEIFSPLGILILALFLGGITLIGWAPRRPPH